MASNLLTCGVPPRSRFPLSLLAGALLAAATAPAQAENWRSQTITLLARPAGSPPSTLYSQVYEVGTQSQAMPAGTPFPPFSASGSWQLVPAFEYTIELRVRTASSPISSPNSSVGQRADLQLSADFTPASAVTWVSSHHEHTTEAGNILQPGLWDQYINIGSGFPWQDASSGSVNGSTAEGTTFIDKPTSSTNTTLTLLASAEVNSWQNVPPPPPYWSGGYYSGLARLEFTVSQPTTLTLDVTASGEVRGESQHFPVLPIVPPNGFSGGSGWWYDPPLALGFDFQMAGGSLFTDILTLPVGIDGDGMFEVEVGNQSLGQFAEGTRVDFRQILGGNGVPAFRIVGIDPAVDSTDAMVFPVQLAFDTPTADFTMTPVLWRKVGTTCADVALCPQCPALELAPVGQAIEGNLNFAIGVDHGPANGIAAFFVGLGSASPAPLPLFCGSVVLPLQNAVVDIGATALTGSAACDGSGSVPLPLVPVPSLLGAFLTVQAITICPAGGLGLTHGIEFAVGS